MNYNEFKNKWKWKKTDFDWQFWFQCTDLSKLFCKEVYGITLWGFNWSALNGWNTWSPFSSRWKRVTNTPSAVPKAWDIIFFNKTATNPYGHTWVVWIKNNINTFTILEQNAGNGKWDWKWANAITERVKGYSKCLGWFTLIN